MLVNNIELSKEELDFIIESLTFFRTNLDSDNVNYVNFVDRMVDSIELKLGR